MTPPRAPTPLEAHLDADRADAARAACMAFLRIPSISAPARARAGRARAPPSGSPTTLRAAGVEHVEVAETGGHPVVYGGLARTPGRADGPRLRPLRRPAGRPARPVGAAAVRAVRRRRPVSAAARPTTRARSTPTSWRPRRCSRRAARCPSTSRSSSRARRSRLGHLDAWLDGQHGPPGADVAVISDTAFFEGNLPAITVGLRGLMYAQIDVVAAPVDLHSGSYGGAVQNPANRAGPDHRGAQGPGRPDPDPGLLRRRRAADASRARGDRRPAVRRGGVSARRSACRRCSARPASRRSSARRAADARRQRHLGRLPGRGRQDDHPGPRPRQGRAAGSSPTRIPTTSSGSSATSSPRSRRPA